MGGEENQKSKILSLGLFRTCPEHISLRVWPLKSNMTEAGPSVGGLEGFDPWGGLVPIIPWAEA